MPPHPAPSPAPTPRVFLLRHGETEWSLSGRFTSTTELPLTAHGTAQVRSTARLLVGPGKLLAPAHLAAVYVSPRVRAQRTAELFFGGGGAGGEGSGAGGSGRGNTGGSSTPTFETNPHLAEWAYGAYEGLLTGEIRARRRAAGLDEARAWDIWRDGCEGGECVFPLFHLYRFPSPLPGLTLLHLSHIVTVPYHANPLSSSLSRSPADVTARLDALIERIRALHGPAMRDGYAADVVLVAHGHVLRAFAKRWLGYELGVPLAMMLEPGGVGVLSYQHGRMEEPAFLLGVGYPVEGEGVEEEGR
ncbi:hypothetical protein MMC32_005260 [Xylographa parallela]|nr:hypothetical protein [Xylographa parallela]